MATFADRSLPLGRAAAFARRILLAAALVFASCVTARSPVPSDPATAIRAANERLATNVRAHDVERLVRDFYSDGSVVAFGGPQAVRGLTAAKEAWTKILEKGSVRLETEAIESSCDMVTEMGRWTLGVEPEQHDFREERGRYFVAWKRTNGEWKAVIHFFSPEGFHEAE
jgi:Ketosteroid isomerase homolog